MKTLALFQLLVGAIYGLGTVWLFMALFGIAMPISWATVYLYFYASALGPILLVVASLLILTRARPTRPVALVSVLGSLAVLITGVVSIAPGLPDAIRKHDTLLVPLFGVLLGLAVLSVFAAAQLYRLVRQVSAEL